ncbi:leucine-rich repeat-containing protein 19 isoform X2 [Xiphophorus hellerii]|uniref:leucine-rich repeat-containing protein 19 isoform X2 n=1 Tax=Xiphophorus hellerii TaxID=8084 RepID=UPI0013B39D22|nr:leucine-rich repeat-containing protein 19 isoform X2 [Xiphophorus hellerii]
MKEFVCVRAETQSKTMDRCWQFLLLMCLSAVAEFGEANDAPLVKNLTDELLQVIPPNDKSNVSILVIKGNQITLNETDQQALTTYPTLVELYVGENLVTAVPANFFSGLSHLRVLSLSRNNINSLDPEAFSGLDVLEELDLSDNKLTDLCDKTFTKLKRLKILHLQENPWNCSCPLLDSIGRMKEANINFGGPNITCASPAEQKGKNLLHSINLCSTSSPAIAYTDHKSPTPPVTSQPSKGINNTPTTTSTSQNCTVSKRQKPLSGHTWKFTACVAALALITCILILTAIKGPSWYKSFHNYRHRRLVEDDEEGGQDTMITETGGCKSQQTFTFEELSHRIQEQEEDGYFEDPYIKRMEDSEEEIQ